MSRSVLSVDSSRARSASVFLSASLTSRQSRFWHLSLGLPPVDSAGDGVSLRELALEPRLSRGDELARLAAPLCP